MEGSKTHLVITFIALFLCAHHAAGQNDKYTFSSKAAAPKKSSVEVSLENTQQGSADAVDGVHAAIDAVHHQIAQTLANVGITPERYEALVHPLVASSKTMLDGLEAVRTAYKKTLTSFYGLLLDNTKELRKTLEDGNSVIDTINDLRGAECTEPSFDPPTAKPARITGAAGSYAVTSGGCTLTRSAAPLQLDYVLDCTEPGVKVTTRPPRYTSRYVSAAAASTEECKVTRKYGVESTTTITLFDPAAFFATDATDTGVSASSGPTDESGFNKGAAWYKALFPVDGTSGQRVHIMPAGIGEATVKALKSIKLDATFNYKPFNMREDMQHAAESIAYTLSKSLAVSEQRLKIFKEGAEYWLDADTQEQISKDMDFKANLKEALKNMNVTTLFDGIFAKKAGKLLAKTPLAGSVGNGKVAAAAAAAVDQLNSERPLRTLLHKARQGSGEPVSVKLSASLEQMMKSAGVDSSVSDAMTSSLAKLKELASGNNFKPGSLLQMLHNDPQFGEKVKQLADTLSAATAGLKQGYLSAAAAKFG